jgi:5-methylcytosine-specific restriction enzyme subunit McrC
MHALFERFVRNFYKREQSFYTVAASQVPWDVNDPVPEEVSFLPVMQTDIVLRSGERTLIIDTKYYNQVLAGRGSPKVQSAHLYQILTYLSQWSQSNLLKSRPDGLLLYAKTAGEAVRLSYTISGFRLQVQTIDLNQPWPSIHSDLLTLVHPEITV